MTVGLILKRMAREWRSLVILLLAVCLLTGFFALGPIYIRAITEVGLRYELDNADPEELKIDLIINNSPLSSEAFEIVETELADLGTDYRFFVRSDYTSASAEDEQGEATGGFLFRYGEPVTDFSPRTVNQYQMFAFTDWDELVVVEEGRLPTRLPPPDVVAPTADDAENQRRQVGIYNRGQVEVVVSRYVADRVDLELGSRLVLGRRTGTGLQTAAVVVVGFVSPIDPEDAFWEGNRTFLEGAEVDLGLQGFRYDYGMATIPEAYTDWLRPVASGSNYIYTVDTDVNFVTADNIEAVEDKLTSLENRLQAPHPNSAVLSGLIPILNRYSDAVQDTEGPIVFLSGTILIMLLYHLINTASLVLEQQGAEWSSIVSRGGSVPQLIVLQLVTVGVLGIVGMLIGPLMGLGFLWVVERVGPLSDALGERSLDTTTIPQLSLLLSIGAAVATVVVLTAPAFPAARKSLLRLKQLISRPPTKPAWARYNLDLVLAIIGIAFMLRLYYLVGGDFGDLLNNIVAAPSDVIDLIADNLNETGGLNDPFNLLGPGLVLTGLALLWLRLFPMLMTQISGLFHRSRRLTTPLAMWNVARDPGHYAQLVLLLIGTLALGTASLGLLETRDRGAWTTARAETGGSASVRLDPARQDIPTDAINWDTLPGVSSAVTFMHVEGDPGSVSVRDVNIIGIQPDAIPDTFDGLAEAADLLANETIVPEPGGLTLPDDAHTLELQVYSMPPARQNYAITVQMTAYLRDDLGITYEVPLLLDGGLADAAGGDLSGQTQPGDVATSGDDVEQQALERLQPTPIEEWRTFSGIVPDFGHPPYRLMRIGMDSQYYTNTGGARQINNNYSHTIYIDQVSTRDLLGAAEQLESFEGGAAAWAPATYANPYAPDWISGESNETRVTGMTVRPANSEVPESDGAGTLRLDYVVTRSQSEPSVSISEPQANPIPVVISPAFAETFTGRATDRSAADRPLRAGDEKRLRELALDTGATEFDYRVVAVLDDIPSFDEKDLVVITHVGLIQPVLNDNAGSATAFFDENETWLELSDREPGDKLAAAIDEIDGVTDVTWAWTRYGEIRREPLPSAVAGMMFVGFAVSLLLSLLDFGFYLVVTARQRLFTFAV
ncbi:MAG: hypothetical protein GYB65_18990, partial [Chloroflexi bacterium]|nr:hypothetical protein [Chloroflexota bacterium]